MHRGVSQLVRVFVKNSNWLFEIDDNVFFLKL